MRSWRRFWFEPQSTSSLALYRIAYGTLVILWAISLTPDLQAFAGGAGVAPDPSRLPWPWSVLWSADATHALAAGCLTLVVLAACAVVVGWHTRVATVLLAVTVVALQQRNPLILNSGDVLLRLEGIYLMLAPAGAALSIDQRRMGGNGWCTSTRAPWALRLVQVQVTVMYLSTALAKVVGGAWLAGTAMWSVWHLEELQRMPTVAAWMAAPGIVRAASVGTLVLEVAIGVLVWSRRARPWVLFLGVVFHLAIDATMMVGVFSWAVLVAYLTFLPPDVGDRVVSTFREAFQARAGSAWPLLSRWRTWTTWPGPH